MSAQVEIPSALLSFTNNEKLVEVPDGTVAAAIAGLIGKYAELKQHLYDESGKLRSFVNVYVNDEDIRYAGELETPVSAGDVIHIVPSISGGR